MSQRSSARLASLTLFLVASILVASLLVASVLGPAPAADRPVIDHQEELAVLFYLPGPGGGFVLERTACTADSLAIEALEALIPEGESTDRDVILRAAQILGLNERLSWGRIKKYYLNDTGCPDGPPR